MNNNIRPPAIILDLQVTALATARCLAGDGIQVHAASFTRRPTERWSRSLRYIDMSHLDKTTGNIAAWLYEYAAKMGNHPVVFPSSDLTALALAKHRDELNQVCRYSLTEYTEYETIISKEQLYARARLAGVNTPPSISEPDTAELRDWCKSNRGPYLVKPFYHAISPLNHGAKNMVFESPESLVAFIERNGSASLIIQRLITGGDGWVYDCYGLCDKEHNIVTEASHTRIRQNPANFGTTCYGEIPASPKGFPETRIFDLTEKLLANIKYHGIFGIEWIQDRDTDDLYLIDFNARPFLSVGHLGDCGLNLPLLAYRELIGERLDQQPLRPRLKHKYWIYFIADCSTLNLRLKNNEITLSGWITSILKARSFAVWRWNDLLPGLHLLFRYMNSILRKLILRKSG